MKVSVFLLVIFLATCQAEDTRVHPHCVEPSPPEQCDPQHQFELAYYVSANKKCEVYTGCVQSNAFHSLQHCHNFCEKTPQEVCGTPYTSPESEMECSDFIDSYTYIPFKKICTQIGYGGCSNSSNIFVTLKQCENYCANV